MKIIKQIILLFMCILFTTFSFPGTTIMGFPFDPKVQLKNSLDGSLMNGYKLQVLNNQQFPYIYIKKGNGENYTYAAYNWKFQFWVYSLAGFNKKSINPKDFYSEVSLSEDLLARDAPSKDIQEKLVQWSENPDSSNDDSEKKPIDNTSENNSKNDDIIPDTSITSLGGYRVNFILPVTSRDQVLFWEKGRDKPVASYNWKKQYWNYIDRTSGFRSETVDLTRLYKKVYLSAKELDRMSPNASYKTQNQMDLEAQTGDRESGWADYDHSAKINPGITSLGGYRVVVDKPVESSGQVFFYSTEPGKTRWMLANYDWKKQYWKWTLPAFDTSRVDLKKLYIQVNKTSDELNRDKPSELTIWNYSHLEKQKYNYDKNPAFKKFMTYLKKGGASQKIQNNYLHWANNPAKLGSFEINSGRDIPEVKLGYFPQFMIKTPEKFYSFYDPRVTRPTHISGGISYYLELGQGNMITATSPAQYLFKSQDIVEITLVEMKPLNGRNTENLDIAELARQMESVLEQAYFKKFRVSVKSVTVNYSEMENVPSEKDVILHRSAFLDKHVHKPFGFDRIYAYYFTDARVFAKIDSHLSHPTSHGAYVALWNRNKTTFVHELGHALGLYHHFGKREQAGKQGAHISEPCIMNYRLPYKNDTICHLCRYALGVPAKNWKGTH